MKKFHRKAEMLTAIENAQIEPQLLLDFLDSSGVHKYTYCDSHKDLFKNIEWFHVKNQYYIYEMVVDKTPRKPYLDLEKTYPDKETCDANYKLIIRKLQKDIISVFKTEYNEIIIAEDILLLNSSGEVSDGYKISLHIIISPADRTLYYINSKYSTSAAYHLYTLLINLDAAYDDLLDDQVYKTDTTLRIIGSAKKLNDNRTLVPIDSKTLKPINPTNKEKLKYLLTYVVKPAKKLTTPLIEQTTKNKMVISKNKPTRTDVNRTLMSYVKEYHPTAEYHGLYKDIYHNFNYTGRQEPCPISGKIHSGTNGFYVCENDRGYYLKCHSKKCKGSVHIGYVDAMDDFIDTATQINQQYLIMNGEINKKPIEPVKDLIKEWLANDGIKTLAVKSAMGTGKTTMIHKILDYDKSIKKILWITHRQTLSKQIYGAFKEHGFKIYLNENGCLFEHDRVIVQVDSVMRIRKYRDSNITFRQYDLVIIDEIEGCLNHFNSPFLEKPDHSARDKFKFILECIDSAKKLLVMDADIGMRTKLFIDNLGKATIINNNYKPITKIFTVSNDSEAFNKKIFDDIKKKKNVCIISMSASALESMVTDLQDKNINFVMHTSKTDDKLKDGLEDVNNFWTKYQVLLYSPTIESGVDFNAEHFDKIYCILKDGQQTCSQRGFLQMVGRIRQIKDPNILCLYTGLTKINSLMYTYDDVLSYFRYYEELNGKKIMENVKYNKIIENGEISLVRVTTELSLFDNISIYNEVEQLNKHPQIFISVLNKLIQRAGHKLKFNIVDKPEPVKKKIDKVKIEDQLAEIDETKYNISVLLKKQSKSQLNETEKLVLQKYFFMKSFQLANSKNKTEFKEFYHANHNKKIYPRRYETMFGYKIKNDDTDFDTDLDALSDGKEKVRIKIIIDLINRLLEEDKTSYKPDELLEITIDSKQYEKAMNDIAENSLYFTNEEKNRSLFFKSKGKYKPINDRNKQFYFSTVQSLLASYNIHFGIKKRKRINKKLVYMYSLSVDKQIKNIVEYKHGETSEVIGFPSIFKSKKNH